MIFKYTVYIFYIYFFTFIDAHLPRILLNFILVFCPIPPESESRSAPIESKSDLRTRFKIEIQNMWDLESLYLPLMW